MSHAYLHEYDERVVRSPLNMVLLFRQESISPSPSSLRFHMTFLTALNAAADIYMNDIFPPIRWPSSRALQAAAWRSTFCFRRPFLVASPSP